MRRFRGRVKNIHVCILLFLLICTFVVFAIYFCSVKYFILFCLTESELNKANKYIYFKTVTI